MTSKEQYLMVHQSSHDKKTLIIVLTLLGTVLLSACYLAIKTHQQDVEIHILAIKNHQQDIEIRKLAETIKMLQKKVKQPENNGNFRDESLLSDLFEEQGLLTAGKG